MRVKSRFVTKTGRAVQQGRTTRASIAVRGIKYAKGIKQDRPLPVELACHPQALTRTTLNPDCDHGGRDSQYGKANGYSELTAVDFLRGLFIPFKYGGYRIVSGITGKNLGWAAAQDALAYRIAAARVGVVLEVYNHERN